jgi:alpha/beta superfamily hydrolase
MAALISQRRGLIETPNAKLDALVFTDDGRSGGAAVILHPYALLGGSIQDHVVTELFRRAAALFSAEAWPGRAN